MTKTPEDIAREIADQWAAAFVTRQAADAIAAALLSYADSRLEEAALQIGDKTHMSRDAAQCIRSLKSDSPVIR